VKCNRAYRPAPHPLAPAEHRKSDGKIAVIAAVMARPPTKRKLNQGRSRSPIIATACLLTRTCCRAALLKALHLPLRAHGGHRALILRSRYRTFGVQQLMPPGAGATREATQPQTESAQRPKSAYLAFWAAAQPLKVSNSGIGSRPRRSVRTELASAKSPSATAFKKPAVYSATSGGRPFET
jgi:hypothetical protein